MYNTLDWKFAWRASCLFLFGNFRPTHSLLDANLWYRAWTINKSEFRRGSLSLLTQLENSAAHFICRSALQPLITLSSSDISVACLLSRMGLGKAARWDQWDLSPTSFIADSSLCDEWDRGQTDSHYSQRSGLHESDQMPISLGYFCFLSSGAYIS